jgi:ABC-type polysaccharide/polyol phosphate export systems, permease component
MNFFSQKNLVLLKELVKTDFKLRYQGSAIGYLWSILKPVMLFTVMYMVFVRFLRFGADVPHWSVALLLGMVTFNFFSEATMMGMTSVVMRGDLLRKLSFSKPDIVVAVVINALINLGINLVVVICFGLVNGVSLGWNMLLVPLLLLELTIFTLGIAFILATIYVKYRDIGPIWEVMMQVVMYATPIIYPITLVLNTHPTIGKIMMLNPMAQIIQDLRYILTSNQNIIVSHLIHNPFIVAIPYLLPLVVFAIGIWYFNKHSRYFAEII